MTAESSDDSITDRIDALESTLEAHQETIERQEERLEAMAEREVRGSADHEPTPESAETTSIDELTPSADEDTAEATDERMDRDDSSGLSVVSRRSALAGLAGLAGLGAMSSSASAATSQGQVGTADRPLNALYAQQLQGVPDGETPFDVLVGGERALRFTAGDGDDAGNVIAGHSSNDVDAEAIGSVISGGRDNQATDEFSAVGGGVSNTASGTASTVGGGDKNTASGMQATVPGGMDNVADGNYSFAAGRNATANHEGAFVVGDSSDEEVVSQTSNEARFQMNTRVEGDVTVNDGGGNYVGRVQFGNDDGPNPHISYSTSSKSFAISYAESLDIGMDIRSTGDVVPYWDADDDFGSSSPSSLGSSDYRWSEVWATNGTIQTSDGRLKTNVSTLEDGLDRVQALRPVSFEWEAGDGDTNLGLIAQEVEAVVPEAVTRPDDDGYLGVNYQTLVPVLVGAIQRQQEELETTRAEVAEREKRVDDLESRVEELERDETVAPPEMTADD